MVVFFFNIQTLHILKYVITHLELRYWVPVNTIIVKLNVGILSVKTQNKQVIIFALNDLVSYYSYAFVPAETVRTAGDFCLALKCVAGER